MVLLSVAHQLPRCLSLFRLCRFSLQPFASSAADCSNNTICLNLQPAAIIYRKPVRWRFAANTWLPTLVYQPLFTNTSLPTLVYQHWVANTDEADLTRYINGHPTGLLIIFSLALLSIDLTCPFGAHDTE